MERTIIREYINDKFKDIEFLEEGHQYYINGVEYTPVSNVISEYENDTDWDSVAKNYATKNNRTVEDVKREWELKNLKSTIAGTRTHKFGESYTNLVSGRPDLICGENLPQYIKKYNALVSTYPKEDAVKKFYDEHRFDLIPVGAEFRLSSKYIPDSRHICGTCDILFWQEDVLNPENSGYVIGDWKTNKSLENDFNRKFNKTMKKPFGDLVDEPLSHYTLQFNLYQRMLESVGVDIIGRKLIWLLDSGDYKIYEIPKLDDKLIDEVFRIH